MEKYLSNGTVKPFNLINNGQINDKPSLTLQGLSEPMETIIQRFQRGQTVLGGKIYYDSQINEDFENEIPFKESDYDLSDLDKARADFQRAQEEIEANKRSKAKAQKLIDDEKLADEVLARRNKKAQELEPKKEPIDNEPVE